MSKATQAFCLFHSEEIKTDLPVQTTPQGWKYFEITDCERYTLRDGKLACAQDEDDAVVQLETVREGARKSLLMSVESELDEMQVRANGLATGRYRVLQPGDVIQIGDFGLYLSLRSRPYIGPPDEQHLGSNCGHCRGAITNRPGSRVYVCPSCRLPTHYEGEEVPEMERLECAKMSAHCGHCQAEIVEEEGFSHAPAI